MKWYDDLKYIFENELIGLFGRNISKNTVFSKDIKNITVPHSNVKNWHCTGIHSHSKFEIMICIQGECFLEVENHYFPVKEGDIVTVGRYIKHGERIADYNKDYRNLYFTVEDNNTLEIIINTFSPKKGFKTVKASPLFILKNGTIADLIENEIENKMDRYEEFSYNYIKSFYIYLYRNIFPLNTKEIIIDNNHEFYCSIISYINDNFYREISIKDICGHLGVNEPYLCNFFKKKTNTTLSNFISYIRVIKAIDILKETNKKVREIACDVGFSDQYYFSKVFKHIIGQSPQEFRKSSLSLCFKGVRKDDILNIYQFVHSPVDL